MKYRKKSPTKRKHWTAAEDQAIAALVNPSGETKWNEVSLLLETQYGVIGRSGKQCRERWHNHLDPGIVKGEWSYEEQLTLFSKHKIYGNTWSHIREYLPGRSENALKNQFYSTMRRQYKKWKGCDPTRSQIKKYDSAMTNQIITALKRKIKVQPPLHETSEFPSLADLAPMEVSLERSEEFKDCDYDFALPPLLADS